MRAKRLINGLLNAVPLVLFSGMLVALLLARITLGLTLPWWGAWALGIFWGVIVFDHLIRVELFKQIGGFVVTFIAVLILIGALAPKETVARSPRMAADQVVRQMEATWNAVYHGNIFKNYSLKQQLIDYGTGLGNLDPFRHGKMILFALLGFALGVVYLFPIEPFRRWRNAFGSGGVEESWSRGETKSNTHTPIHPYAHTFQRSGSAAYICRCATLFLAGAVFALQVELLQVLSPTRLVTGLSLLDSCLGLLAGLLLFVPVHLFYVFLAERRKKGSPRFNVLGVGVDAVNMGDCLKLFEEIISWKPTADSMQLKRAVGCELNAESSYSNPSQDEAGTLDMSGRRKTENSELSSVTRHLSSGRDARLPAMTAALGVAGIVEARRNQKLQRILNESVLNTPDGMPLVWLGKLFGYRSIERVYGPDLLRDACAYGEARGWRHFFYGAAPGIVEKLKIALEQKHPAIRVSGIYCPPFRDLTPEEETEVVDMVNSSGTDIFWIGISTPKQLYFMDRIRSRLTCKIICPVGYAFDVNAGVEEDAPDWAKYSGFQWLHRAIKQPRLWKRYLPDNPRFVWEVILQVLHLKRYPMLMHERIVEPETDAEGYPRFPAGVVSLSAMSLEGARDRVLNWVRTGQRHYVNICTADTMVQCFDRPDMAKIVKNAGMATTDGMPLVWLAHHYGFKDATRVYGPDLMLELCRVTSDPAGFRCYDLGVKRDEHARESLKPNHLTPNTEKKCISHFFYGATDEVLEQLKANLLKKFPDLKVAGMYSPPFRPLTDAEKDEVAEMINASGADIVWCGLGTPKQDYWVAEFRPRLNCAAILAVGAAFNFHAGHVRQAPRWMMCGGLEWFFRLCTEPKRLWRRYLIGNPRFIMLTWRQFLSRS
ncbi:WecB/TagA/CpsF family glycosyltransferase [Tichowtungia aerotolerans]|uniref:WecB/TagA/CpsF family glycosyltransferase n=1 Tax=Tichowtungia aerotolerans TaxID=2697043 RepID=A0A6P1MDP3_9BACT|nr:WecB/TagA/CpsF family glycosyltransferase [Tichowtungia aerotolerans]QHI70198.1 WecB/TagA/CpsF family glycosyltransferase [Tichowtungia aerotolerans]